MHNIHHQKVRRYYQNPESRLGFDHILWGSKHFGYYPSGKADITEREAQILMQDLVAENVDLKESQTVLDAGCGQGVVSTYLTKEYGPHIFGITIVPFEVRKAQQRAKKCGVEEKITYQLMDYSATTFPDNYFDAIYTTETLSHSPDIQTTLGELFRILKPGGTFAFFEYTIAPDEAFSDWERRMLDLVIDGSAMMGLKAFRHDQFTDALRSVGFEGAEEQNISENILPSFYRLHKFSIWPYAFIRHFGLQRFFINTTAGYEYYKLLEKGLMRYCIFTGYKPRRSLYGGHGE